MFIVLEIQKNDDNVSVLTNQYEELGTAENKYHTILAYAAVSEVDVHTAVIINEYGLVIKREQYDHTQKGGEEDEISTQ